MVVRAENNALAESTQKSVPSKLFDEFVQAQTCNQIFATFHNLCQAIDIVYPPLHSSTDHCLFYPRLKQRLSDSWKAESLWKKLDKRFYGKEYFVNPKSSLPDGKRIGESHKVLIIGAGPCGLRTAIEMACLGVKAVVVEKRDNFSRNNVLHLWPFIITDLKTLGAKIFHGKFCAGAIDHISIRQLQLILLKVTLLLGVEVVVNVGFEHLSCPVDDVIREDGTTWHKGWSATVSPSNHHISNFEFDVIVGADGKRNTLQGFKRKEFRGKLAIGLTVNFINRRTTAEAKVQEISGVAYIFNQQFFKDLLDKTNIDLENIVYYKGETHYFVMTAKKHSLITKGVLKQDYDDTEKLLCYANVDQEALGVYAREAADFSTNYKLPNLEFAINQYGQPDIALFDFTCMYAAENAAMFQEVKGRKLLSCLVGDSLLEPFWPMGTGCARGFLAAFDLVWMVRRLCLERGAINNNNIVTADSNLIELEALAERESVYRLLHHSTPQNTAKNWAKYTIDPSTRYTNLNRTKVSVKQVRRLYLSDRDIAFNRDEDEEEALIEKRQHEIDMQVEEEKKHPHLNQALTRKVSLVRSNKLLTWCRRITAHYGDIVIRDMTSSWKSGLALSAIIHQFRPDLISWEDLDPAKVEENNQLAFDVAEKYFGISPVMTGKEMASCQEVDKLVMVTYISQFYEVFKNETPAHDHKRGEQAVKNDSLEPPKSPLSSTSPVGLLIRFTNHIKRKSEKSKHDDPAKKKKLGGFFKKKENSSLATEVIHENKENEGIESAGTLNVGGTVVQLRNKDPELTASGQNNVNVNSQRTSNRISALSSQLMSQFEQNAPLAKPYSERVTSKQVSIPDESMSDKCYFCERRIYIVERMSAEGLFFHRQCFVCSHCGVTLRRGNYEFLSDTGKFFCKAHYMAHSGAFKTADQKRAEATDSIMNKASNTLTTLNNEGVGWMFFRCLFLLLFTVAISMIQTSLSVATTCLFFVFGLFGIKRPARVKETIGNASTQTKQTPLRILKQTSTATGASEKLTFNKRSLDFKPDNKLTKITQLNRRKSDFPRVKRFGLDDLDLKLKNRRSSDFPVVRRWGFDDSRCSLSNRGVSNNLQCQLQHDRFESRISSSACDIPALIKSEATFDRNVISKHNFSASDLSTLDISNNLDEDSIISDQFKPPIQVAGVSKVPISESTPIPSKYFLLRLLQNIYSQFSRLSGRLPFSPTPRQLVCDWLILPITGVILTLSHHLIFCSMFHEPNRR